MKKKLMSYLVVAMFSLTIFTNCEDNNDEEVKQKGNIEFSFSLTDITESSKKIAKTDVQDASAVVVTIKDTGGNVVYDTKEIELYNMSGSFISKSILLFVGSYTIEEFLVIDADGNVIYASPLQGSDMAYLVSTTLPYNFSVASDETLKLVPEVLSTENVTSEDFGYTTFSFEVVETFDFLLSVFAYDEATDNFELTNAMLTVTANSNDIYSDTLEAITNQIKINDGFDSYILTIEKEGYVTYIDSLTNNELKQYFRDEDNGPLVVTFEQEDELSKITDIDGNEYNVVKIGNQVWMAENLKVTREPDSTDIPLVTDNTEWGNLEDNDTDKAYCYYNNLNINRDTYGALYTYAAAKDACPTGWHLPSDEEWKILEMHIGMSQSDADEIGPRGTDESEKLKATNGWNSSGNGTDNYSFSALPGGNRYSRYGTFRLVGEYGDWWSSTDYDSTRAFERYLGYNLNFVGRYALNKSNGYSVRCVRD